MDRDNPHSGLDLCSFSFGSEPKYTTFPGTHRDTTLIHGHDEQQHIDDTVRGAMYQGDSREYLKQIIDSDQEIDLIVTSPPFGLRKKKEYGNEDPEDYIEWFLDFAELAYQALADDGDFVVDIGGGWVRGEPIRSTYHFELLIDLATDRGKLSDRMGQRFNLSQDFYWYNPAKLPTPAQWVTIERIRVKDAVNHVWWFSKDNARRGEEEKPDNRAVLKPYSDAQKSLMENGYNDKMRPSGHRISNQFDNPTENGAIRPNFWDLIENQMEPMGLHDMLDFAGVSPELRRAAEKEDRIEELAEFAVDDEALDEFTDLMDISTDAESPVMKIANTRSRTHYLVGCDKLDMDPHPARFPRELPEFFIQLLTDPEDLVVDIFAGSNMTGWVAQQYDRNWLSFEMNSEYIESSRFWFMSEDDIDSRAETISRSNSGEDGKETEEGEDEVKGNQTADSEVTLDD